MFQLQTTAGPSVLSGRAPGLGQPGAQQTETHLGGNMPWRIKPKLNKNKLSTPPLKPPPIGKSGGRVSWFGFATSGPGHTVVTDREINFQIYRDIFPGEPISDDHTKDKSHSTIKCSFWSGPDQYPDLNRNIADWVTQSSSSDIFFRNATCMALATPLRIRVRFQTTPAEWDIRNIEISVSKASLAFFSTAFTALHFLTTYCESKSKQTNAFFFFTN